MRVPRFKDFPIREKFLAIILAIYLFVVILAFAGFTAYDTMMFRKATEREMTTIAALIGHACTAALLFDDPVDATETLLAFETYESIEEASIYTQTGKFFAGYVRDGLQAKAPSHCRQSGCCFKDGGLSCFQPIMLEGVSVGTVFIRSDLTEMQATVRSNVGIIAAILLISLVCAWLLSARLQRLITGPVVRLANMARSISKDKDYSIRGTKEAEDEIGCLVDAFNDMLGQIEEQNQSLTLARERAEASTQEARQSAAVLDQINLKLEKEIRVRLNAEAHLQKYQRELEQMIKARTAQLSLTNEQLSREIAERKEVEIRIRTSLNEKSMLLGEIHHRVRNNLQVISSLLSLSRRRTLSDEARQVLAEARSRVFTMALIHSQLYGTEDFNQVDMGRHVHKLWLSIHQIYEPMKRDVTPLINCQDVNLTITQAIPCALVLNEAITNVFKHAYGDGEIGPCHITMKRSRNDRILIRVRDEGRGIPETVDFETTDTLGIKLMRDLVRHQLRGQFRIERNGGTDIWIEFDLSHEEPLIHAESEG
jgi:two-component sensor histidine kinase/HAMP domain-containing protein